jgi:hypothetical protein
MSTPTIVTLHTQRPDMPCSNDPDLWHLPGKTAEAEAKALCKDCPVIDACLRAGLDPLWPGKSDDVPDGVWGGYTKNERKAMLRYDRKKKAS